MLHGPVVLSGGDLDMPDEMAIRDEDYEIALQQESDFEDISQYGIVEVAGKPLRKLIFVLGSSFHIVER